MRRLKYFIFFILGAGCVEPYTFVVHDDTKTLVVEGSISDKSFSDTKEYPSDGRYFSIKLTATGDVTNVRPEPVMGAAVKLVNDTGEEWEYTESEPGIYRLYNDVFKAQVGVKYKLHIASFDENIYESDWEELPVNQMPGIGQIAFTESEKQVYVVEAMKPVLRWQKIVTTKINLPKNDTGTPIYYRWQFSPLWVYKAPLASSSFQEGYTCWATDNNHLNTFSLQLDNSGGYEKELFNFPTIRNERIFEDFSVLITQHGLSEKNFFFWKEMMEQNESSVLVDKPPFNLQTNIKSLTGSKRVSGMFQVTQEQATRWYFNRHQLSYNVINTLKGDCLVDYGPGGPAPECTDCREYSNGKATNVKPSWWEL